jgi:hypothetical protein
VSFDFATKAKKITHGVAIAGGAVVAWAMSDQGRAVIGGIVKAYPKASVLTGVLAFLGTLYYKS